MRGRIVGVGRGRERKGILEGETNFLYFIDFGTRIKSKITFFQVMDGM